MALILDDLRPQGRQFGNLIAVDLSHRARLLDLLRQGLTPVAAIGGQHRNDLIDAFRWLQLAMAARMALLSARPAPASAARRFLPAGGGRSVVGGRLGGVGGILFPAGQLAFQIGNLLFGAGDLLFGVGDLLFGVGDLLVLLSYLAFKLLDLPP